MNTKPFRAFAVLLLATLYTPSLAADRKPLLLPLPAQIQELPGYFRLRGPLNVSIDAPDRITNALQDYLRTTTLPNQSGSTSSAYDTLHFCLTNADTPTSDEGYRLLVMPDSITIRSRGAAGLFYGLQTLLQLHQQYGNRIPAQQIVDAPRFTYRGLHLDVSRHFFDKEFVKKQMRMMASLKLNRLHWHLTDGAGWRIAIDRYPLLTEVAAWRRGQTWAQWRAGGEQYCRYDEPGAYGGFYTKAEIREVVDYARQLHIVVIPEIEMPSHSGEVLAVYPELGCPGHPSGSSEFCLGNDRAYTFVEQVLSEVMELFPSEYIHIGGDEAEKSGWETCPVCCERMDREGITSPEELQGYFVRHVARFLQNHGRKMIGWDEVLEDTLPSDAVIMSWRGEQGGRRAAQLGHRVIMTPNPICYFDSYQDNPLREPQAMSGFVVLKDVYAYDPAPADMQNRDWVMGVQANLWAEYIPTPEHAEHMLYPRLFALAERAWSNHQNLDYDDFLRRVLWRNKSAIAQGYTPFDQEHALGDRTESLTPIRHLAIGCPVSYAAPFSDRYPASGVATLTDGVRGSWGYITRWQGFLDCDVDVTIDLGVVRKIGEVTADFIEWDTSWIWLPVGVEILVSTDGKTYHTLSSITNEAPLSEKQPQYRSFGWKGSTQARYVRYCALSGGRPGGWIFTDEIIVR